MQIFTLAHFLKFIRYASLKTNTEPFFSREKGALYQHPLSNRGQQLQRSTYGAGLETRPNYSFSQTEKDMLLPLNKGRNSFQSVSIFLSDHRISKGNAFQQWEIYCTSFKVQLSRIESSAWQQSNNKSGCNSTIQESFTFRFNMSLSVSKLD